MKVQNCWKLCNAKSVVECKPCEIQEKNSTISLWWYSNICKVVHESNYRGLDYYLNEELQPSYRALHIVYNIGESFMMILIM